MIYLSLTFQRKYDETLTLLWSASDLRRPLVTLSYLIQGSGLFRGRGGHETMASPLDLNGAPSSRMIIVWQTGHPLTGPSEKSYLRKSDPNELVGPWPGTPPPPVWPVMAPYDQEGAPWPVTAPLWT